MTVSELTAGEASLNVRALSLAGLLKAFSSIYTTRGHIWRMFQKICGPHLSIGFLIDGNRPSSASFWTCIAGKLAVFDENQLGTVSSARLSNPFFRRMLG